MGCCYGGRPHPNPPPEGEGISMSGMVKSRQAVAGATTPGGKKPWLRSRLTAFCAKGALTAGSPSSRGCRSRRSAPGARVIRPADSWSFGLHRSAPGARVISGIRPGCARPGPTPAATTRPWPARTPRRGGQRDRCALNRRYPYHGPAAHRQTRNAHRRVIAPTGRDPDTAGPVRQARNHHCHTAQEQEVLYALWLGQNRRRIRKAEAAVKSSILHVTEAVKEGRARLSPSDPEQLAEQMEQALDKLDLNRRQPE